LLIAQNKADEALCVLNELRTAACAAGRLRCVLEIEVVMVLAHNARHDMVMAQRALDELLIRAQSAGYQRLFIDEAIVLAPLLLSFLLAKREQPAMATYAQNLLNVVSSQSPGSFASDTQDSVLPNEPLTPQEERSVYLFVNGLSKKEIADELRISVNTVKTHLQRAYHKLNVSTRAEAREMARRHKLLQ